MYTVKHEEKRSGMLHKGRRRDQMKVMDTSYKRRYNANCFSSSKSINRFFFYFGFDGRLVNKMYSILKA